MSHHYPKTVVVVPIVRVVVVAVRGAGPVIIVVPRTAPQAPRQLPGRLTGSSSPPVDSVYPHFPKISRGAARHHLNTKTKMRAPSALDQ